MVQCGQAKSCSCNFSFPRQSTYFRFVMQAGDLGHGKESASELQGGTHMHHSCPLVMSQVFCCRFVFASVEARSHSFDNWPFANAKKGRGRRTGPGYGTATRPKLLAKAH